MDQKFDDNKLKISDINTEKLDGDTMEDPDDAPLMSEFEIECFDDVTNELETITENFDGVEENIRRYSEECKGCFKDSKTCDCLKVNTGECSVCHKIFYWTSKLIDAVVKPSTCTTCVDDAFTPRDNQSELGIIYTLNRPSQSRGIYECNICGISLLTSAGMYKHKKRHMEEKRYECEICHKKFTTKATSDQHLRIHTGEIPFACSIPGCLKKYRYKSSLISHTKMHTTTENRTSQKVFECPICGEFFTNKYYVTKHMQTDHTREKPLQCEVCHIKFAKKKTLTEHLKIHTSSEESVNELKKENDVEENTDFRIIKCETVRDEIETELNEGRSSLMNQHTGNCDKSAELPTYTSCNPERENKRTHKCVICRKSFSCKRKVARHMLTHTGEKPFKCDICHKRFTQKSSLTYHGKCHREERPFVCSYQDCLKTFKHKKVLILHTKLVHTKEMKRTHKLYPCTICRKTFSNKGNVTKHMRTHTGEKPFECEVCHKGFSERGHLYEHMLIHTGEKPYVCPVQDCLKAFRVRRSFHNHTKKYHKNQEDIDLIIKCETETQLIGETSSQLNQQTDDVQTDKKQRQYKIDGLKSDPIEEETFKLNNDHIDIDIKCETLEDDAEIQMKEDVY